MRRSYTSLGSNPHITVTTSATSEVAVSYGQRLHTPGVSHPRGSDPERLTALSDSISYLQSLVKSSWSSFLQKARAGVEKASRSSILRTRPRSRSVISIFNDFGTCRTRTQGRASDAISRRQRMMRKRKCVIISVMSSVGDNHTFSVGDFLIAGGLYSVTALRENAREITRDKESVFAMSDEGRGMTSKNMSDAHQGARR